MKSKYLFEINHPCHAHLFKHSIRHLIDQGCRVDVLVKPGKIIDSILTASCIAYIPQKPRAKSLAGKILKQFAYTSQAIRLQLKHKYKLGIGVSVTLPAAAVFSGLNTLVLDDDDKKATPLFAAIAHRFSETLLRPSCRKPPGMSFFSAWYMVFNFVSKNDDTNRKESSDASTGQPMGRKWAKPGQICSAK